MESFIFSTVESSFSALPWLVGGCDPSEKEKNRIPKDSQKKIEMNLSTCIFCVYRRPMSFGGSEDTLINYHAFDGNPVPAGSHLFKAPIYTNDGTVRAWGSLGTPIIGSSA